MLITVMAAVELETLTKYFGGAIALDSLTLTIPHGSLVCLLGPSGCGKTTTLRLIAGFLDPDQGTIRVGGRIVSQPGRTVPPERRGMSMIFQSYALWPHMTIAENVAYGLKLRRIDRTERERRVRTILDVTRLGEFASRYPHELSGGQQQRAALARALVVEPETLLLDEPLSNLDAGLREEMRFEIRRLHDAYKYTTIYVTHDQGEAMTTADTIVVMNHGRVEQIGSPEEVYQRPDSEFVARFIGGTNIFRGRHMGNGIVDCGAVVLRCGAGEPAATGETAVSVRLHDIVLTPDGADRCDRVPNEAPGHVVRQSYLGPYRDYLIGLRDGSEVRVTVPVGIAIPVGASVRLHFPPEHCRALSR